MTAREVLVLVFGDRRVPRALADLTAAEVSGPDALVIPAGATRVIVVGEATDLAATLSRLLRDERLDVEVGFVEPWRPTRWGSARRARHGAAQRVPLIRDETATVIVRSARWLPSGADAITGEAVVDDTVLFDGASAGVE
ncbi:MAG: peptidase M50, partial [Mycobacterium sp.]